MIPKAAATIVLILGACSSVAQNATNTTDLDILNFALTLEHLEYAFYNEGLSLSFGSLPPRIVSNLHQIRDHEKTHVDALEATITSLGGTPVESCEYDFGFNSSEEFLSIAGILENVGTSAYTGAAYWISNKTLLTIAATIATVEARHSAYLNQVNGESPFPAAFDSPLDAQSVYGLASGFITSCPSSLGIVARPSLSSDSFFVEQGESVNLTSSLLTSNWQSVNGSWCVFYASSASTSSLLQWEEASATTQYWCRVPSDAYLGDTYLFLSWNQSYVLTDVEPIIAGPAIIFVKDSDEDDDDSDGDGD